MPTVNYKKMINSQAVSGGFIPNVPNLVTNCSSVLIICRQKTQSGLREANHCRPCTDHASVKANVWHQINAVISHFLEGTVMVHLCVLGFVDSKIGFSLPKASLV